MSKPNFAITLSLVVGLVGAALLAWPRLLERGLGAAALAGGAAVLLTAFSGVPLEGIRRAFIDAEVVHADADVMRWMGEVLRSTRVTFCWLNAS